MSNNTIPWGLAGIAAVVLVTFLARTYLADGKAAVYVTTQARVQDVEQCVLASGTLEASTQVSVGAQASGQVKSLLVALGDRVKKGQLIAQIDSVTQQNTLRTNEAALASCQAERKAKLAALRKARQELARQREMLDQDASARQDLEAAQAQETLAQAEVRMIEAQVEQARIAVDTARVNLGYTRITAPMDGVVVAIVTREGQTVNASQTAPTIIKLARLETMTVKAQISEADVTRVAPGQQVYFTILGEPQERYRAVLRAIEPAPDSITSSDSTSSSSSASSSSSSTSTSSAIYYNGLFEVPNSDGKLRISMTAQVSIILNQATGAVTVPLSALGEPDASGRRLVRVVDDKGQAWERSVRVGIDDNVNVQVLEGLAAGEQVVIGEAKAGLSEEAAPRRHGPPPMM